MARCITQADVIFISVNTPSKKADISTAPEIFPATSNIGIATDMRAFFSVVNQIGELFDPSLPHKIIIEKSTVPLGTAIKMREHLAESVQRYTAAAGAEASGFDDHYTLVNMPEFLAEGSAI